MPIKRLILAATLSSIAIVPLYLLVVIITGDLGNSMLSVALIGCWRSIGGLADAFIISAYRQSEG